ncbi:hypothetical protein [Actinoplanes sp. RD1]|uniref:hypothetical protein n=1 Tax=Actinoplanes sp. RD1 TaxID=3064538 RepID=UPI002741A6F3|nr:hypothetical protein [Actinoplanes sp. RD1]
MGDLLINLLASVIAGTAVWLAQFGLRRRRLDRKRAFFGVADGSTSLLVTSRHYASPSEHSVHRDDAGALIELATLVRECGGRPDFATGADVPRELGRVTEFSVGGPTTNPRAAVHLRAVLRGIEFRGEEPPPGGRWPKLTLVVGDREFVSGAGERYAVLARFTPPAGTRPVFFIGGLTALANLAAARYLGAHHDELRKTYGEGGFALVLRVREPQAYGTDFTEVVADVSEVAFQPAASGED